MVNINKGYMEFSFYKKIIDQIEPFASAITLALGGESMLHPDFFGMIRYAVSRRIKVMLNTNATLLDEEKAHQLLDSELSHVSFAFDGFDKESYEKARVGASFEKTSNYIINFLKLKKKKNKTDPYTVLSALKLGLDNSSQETKEAFLQQFDGLIDEVRMRDVSSWGSTFKDSDEFCHDRYDIVWTPCSRLWNTVCITWNGEVLPCVYNMNHEYVLGNVKNEPFLNIWNGPKMIQLRKAMIDGTYLDISPLCENCIVIGTPPILGIPSGIRLTLADAVTNVFGYRFERVILYLLNKFRKGDFTSVTIK